MHPAVQILRYPWYTATPYISLHDNHTFTCLTFHMPSWTCNHPLSHVILTSPAKPWSASKIYPWLNNHFRRPLNSVKSSVTPWNLCILFSRHSCTPWNLCHDTCTQTLPEACLLLSRHSYSHSPWSLSSHNAHLLIRFPINDAEILP